MPGVHHVKDAADLEEKLTEAGSKLVVIDFFAQWCGPCKQIGPKIEELSLVETDVVFLKVDVDECEAIAGEYDISSMPTFVFLKEKKQIEEFTGANPNKLVQLVNELKGSNGNDEETEEVLDEGEGEQEAEEPLQEEENE